MASKEEQGAHRIRKWLTRTDRLSIHSSTVNIQRSKGARLCTFYRRFIHEGVRCGYHGECSKEPQMDV
jgi:hypothetical protein